MNPEVKKKWVEALRSGRYKQGVRSLRSQRDHYCCLGVLCDVYRKETRKGRWVTVEKTPYTHVYAFRVGLTGEGVIFLPSVVVNWAGLRGADPYIDKPGYAETLSNLNDTPYSFAEIADLIEEVL